MSVGPTESEALLGGQDSKRGGVWGGLDSSCVCRWPSRRGN